MHLLPNLMHLNAAGCDKLASSTLIVVKVPVMSVSSNTHSPAASPERSWLIILIACAFLVVITMGVRQSFGLFLLPVTEALGSGREIFSLAMALQNLMWGLASPIAGGFADKFGSARVAVIGTVCYAAGLVMMSSLVTPSGLIAGNLLIGVGLGSAGMSIALGAVGKAVSPQRRTLALGLVTSLGSFGQFAMLPVTQAMMDGLGWQMTLIMLSILTSSMLASCLVLHRQSKNTEQATTADVAKLSASEALNTAAHSRNYILLTVGFFVCGIQIVFIGTHLPTYIQDAGLDVHVASWALSMVGLFNIIGSFAAGWLGSFMRKSRLLAIIYLLRSVAMVAFVMVEPSPASAILFGCVMGLLWLSTVPLTSGLIVVFFGPAFLSMLYGVAFLSHQIGSFLGAWLGGWIYDNLGSYELMWQIVIASGVFAFIINLMIGETHPKTQPAE